MKNKYADALCKEALFTGEMLCAGYTQIRKANYASRGVYFQAFTSLSTGFERIGKLCYLLIYSIEHDGVFPTNRDMQNDVRHDILKLYELILDFKNENNIKYDVRSEEKDKSDDLVSKNYNYNLEYINEEKIQGKAPDLRKTGGSGRKVRV
mgnify:CR=1 FL=1